MSLLTLLQSLPEFDPQIAAEFGADASTLTFLGAPLFEAQSMLNLLVRFLFNLVVAFVIVRCFYYPKSHRRDYFLTFMVFSSTMFLLIFCMENVKLGIGLTLGLFAIFGMIRYRTETVPVREMTYLFVIIGVSVINGLALSISYAELLAANLLIILLIWALESQRLLKHTSTKIVLYEKIDLIVPERREELIADLEKRIGIKINNLEIGHVDFLRDTAMIKIYYTLGKDETNTIDHLTKPNQFAG